MQATRQKTWGLVRERLAVRMASGSSGAGYDERMSVLSQRAYRLLHLLRMEDMGTHRGPVARTDASTGAAREIAIWTAGFLALALATRLVRYVAGFPLWGDEAAVALNLLDRGFGGLLRPLDYGQLAPPGFLFSARALLLALGTSDTALRLAPFAVALGSVAAFAWLSRLATPQLGRLAAGMATFPVALFAVSYYPIRYAAELKPYSLDILVACLVLGLAARWLSCPPGHDASLGALAAVACVGPWFNG